MPLESLHAIEPVVVRRPGSLSYAPTESMDFGIRGQGGIEGGIQWVGACCELVD